MHLGKRLQFNMIIAILLCMAFVVNIGVTLASVDYSFMASSVNSASDYDTYIEYGNAQATNGTYIYSPGTYNNQLSINYGFSSNYDLMIQFTATYTDDTHKANDFALNFANRDKWLLDMGSVSGWKVENNATITDTTQTYYNLTSSSYSVSGVMYYMDTLSGSGTLPVISGVDFYTSPNNSYNYIGDTLTITLTPHYVKTDTTKYTTSHDFYSQKVTASAFNNWAAYMSGTSATAEDATYMIYNAYVDKDRSLGYPYDNGVVNASGVVQSGASSPDYANTSYRYAVNADTSLSYSAITAGNKYYGGLGVYVIPNSSATTGKKVVTIGVGVNYFWQNNNVIAGTTPSGMVSLGYSTDITTITQGTTNYHYYKATISSPTYVNILDYIKLTAEYYSTIISNNYSLILNNISVSLETSTPSGWTSQTAEQYEVHNSSEQSSILVRVQDIISLEKSYDTNISITNNSSYPLIVNSFNVRGYLWYGAYTSQTIDEQIITTFTETPLGDIATGQCYLRPNYLSDDSGQQISPSAIWGYNQSLWSVSYNASTYTYTFSNSSGTAYIPSGYTMTLIDSVTIPQTSKCKGASEANDFWCSLQLSDVNATVASSTAPSYSSLTSSTGVETMVEGYYTTITLSAPGKIYVRNNTNQVITNINLTNVTAVRLSSGTKLPRDRMLTGESNIVTTTNTKQFGSAISLKPNEMVLAYTITPSSGTAIIHSFTITATLEGSAENKDIDLVYTHSQTSSATITNKGDIINNSEKYYEFRLKSATDLTSTFIDSTLFEERVISGTYYYYYKGIMASHRCISIFNSFAQNVTVEYIEHQNTWDSTHYVASNYTAWGLNDTNDKNWLDAMKKLYDAPTDAEREGATIVSAPTAEEINGATVVLPS